MTQPTPRPVDPRTDRRRTVVSAVAIVLTTAYAVVAALQSLILNPLLAAPGRTLDQIHADLAAAGESMMTEFVIGLLAAGPVSVVVVAVLAHRRQWSVGGAAMIHLSILAAGAGAYVIAGQGPAVAIADTYPDWARWEGSPWGIPLVIISAAAFLLLLLLIVIAVRRGHHISEMAHPGSDPSVR